MPSSPHGEHWWTNRDSAPRLLAKNVGGDYAAIVVNVVIGLFMLPFNVAHLGQSTYGLWVLATSFMTYFSVLDLGYGSAQVKFAAQYRARRDTAAINQIVSTLFFLFLGIATIAYTAVVAVAFNLEQFFNIARDQATLGRDVLLVVGLTVAAGFPVSVFGGVVNGFQRYYSNAVNSITTSIVTALVNVAVLLAGYGLVTLVACTTAVRLASYLLYAYSAFSAFPPLSVRWRHVRKTRLREVTAFSGFLLLINIAAKINFTSNTMVIGALLGPAAITSWTVAHRLTDVTRMLTAVLTRSTFPMVVDHKAHSNVASLRELLLHGTRLSMAAVVPLASVTAVLAGPLVHAWVGPEFAESIPVVYVLAAIVTIGVGSQPTWTLLKGTGHHRSLAKWSLMSAVTNLAISILLARRFGLVGVAIGSLIPMSIMNGAARIPAACREVQLPLGRFLRTAALPTLWPAVIPCALLASIRDSLGTNVFLIVGAAAAAGLLYAALFLGAAISGDERRWYFGKLRTALRPARPVAA
jgi:O-antigen/teichoic acid export membrane protein